MRAWRPKWITPQCPRGRTGDAAGRIRGTGGHAAAVGASSELTVELSEVGAGCCGGAQPAASAPVARSIRNRVSVKYGRWSSGNSSFKFSARAADRGWTGQLYEALEAVADPVRVKLVAAFVGEGPA